MKRNEFFLIFFWENRKFVMFGYKPDFDEHVVPSINHDAHSFLMEQKQYYLFIGYDCLNFVSIKHCSFILFMVLFVLVVLIGE